MKTFEQLQIEKTERAMKLLEILPQLSVAELTGEKELVERALKTFADNLKLLLAQIKEQKKLCGVDNQCNALLDEERSLLEDTNRKLETSLITHVENAAQGGELQISPIGEALRIIASRKHSLPQLKAA